MRLPRIGTEGFLIRSLRVSLRPQLREMNRHVVVARCELQVPDRNTGEPTTVVSEANLEIDVFDCTDEELVALARTAAINALVHELDEQLRVDGIRYRDPHRGDPA